MVAPTVNFEGDPRHVAKGKEIAELGDQLLKIRDGNSTAIAEVDAKLFDANAALRQVDAYNAHLADQARSEKRIEELAAEEKKLAGEIERIDRELFLTDEWIRVKVGLLEESINSQFKIARFRLFEIQINGGLNEVCETLASSNGSFVPWSSLNNGMRVNVGLDIINTFARVHDFAPPIFIDNAESVTSLIPTTGQQIRLVVSEADKTLRVITETTKELQTA